MTPKSSSVKRVGDYALLETIGVGSFSKVRRGLHLPTNTTVAIKIYDKSKFTDDDDFTRLRREITLHKSLKHPNIVDFIELIESSRRYYIVLEYLSGGELSSYIAKHPCGLSERESCRLFHQLIQGVEYCHANKVIHRDLKLENLLLDGDKNLKICDFGLSNCVSDTSMVLTTACGSLHYASPELISGKPYTGPSVDNWACGVILYTLLSGHLPFEDSCSASLFQKIAGGCNTFPDHISTTATSLLRGLLCVDAQNRFDLDNVKKHPWFTLFSPRNFSYTPVMDDELLSQLSALGLDTDALRSGGVLRDLYFSTAASSPENWHSPVYTPTAETLKLPEINSPASSQFSGRCHVSPLPRVKNFSKEHVLPLLHPCNSSLCQRRTSPTDGLKRLL
ncbi:hypothetical protein RCL1_004883 [Eukaryota sp. TZLM3-RCL]